MPSEVDVADVTAVLPASWRPDAGGTAALLAMMARRTGAEDLQPRTCTRLPDGRWEVVLSHGARPLDRVEVRLGPTARPGDAERVAAHLATRGLELVGWEPHARRAWAARLWPAHSRLRSQIAERLRCQPWETEIQVSWRLTERDSGERVWAIGTVWVKGSQTIPDAARRREVWLGIARELIPAIPGTAWWVDDRPVDSLVVLRRAEDPLGAVLAYPWDAGLSVTGVPFALSADGTPVTLGLLEINSLLGGLPGSGKSGGLTALLCGISRLEHVAIIGIDPKRVELGLWKDRCSIVARTDDEITEVLTRLVAEMERRYEALEDLGRKKITPEMLSDELPLLVVVIDELADIVSTGVTKEDRAGDEVRATLIRRLIAKGRAAGLSVIAATQKPQSDVVPTALRDLIQLRVGFATTSSHMTDTILGLSMSLLGGVCHEIPPSLRGVCYIVSESDRTPTRARCWWVPDEEVADRAVATAHLRVDLPWLAGVISQPPPPAVDAGTIELGELSLSLDELEGSSSSPAAATAVTELDDPWED